MWKERTLVRKNERLEQEPKLPECSDAWTQFFSAVRRLARQLDAQEAEVDNEYRED